MIRAEGVIMQLLISSVLAVAMSLLVGVETASAQSRLALVIGINDYQNVFSLQKAVGDAKAIQGALQGLGFQVSTLFNGNRRSFNAALSAFSARIQPGDIVLLHYSGHGVQLDGENFLLPADVPSPSAVDKEFLKSEAIALSVMIDRIKTAGARTAVFIIDACRNNPYAAATTRGVGGTRGLAAVAPPRGTCVMYSAGQGQSALDRLSDDDREPTSVYTRTLRAKMLVEGLAITDLARTVRDEVETAAGRVNHEQRPAYYDELSGAPFYFVPPKDKAATRSQPTTQPCSSAAEHWRSAEAIGTIAAFEDHLARFPNCAFAGLAKARLESTKQKSAAILPHAVSPSDRDKVMNTTTTPDSVKAVFEKHHLLGNLAWDCTKPASKSNFRYVHSVLDGDRVQREQMSGPTSRDWVVILDKASEAGPNQIALSGTLTGRVGGRDLNNTPTNGVWHVEPNRLVQWEATVNGEKTIEGGRYVSTGVQVPWMYRCGR